MHGELQHSCVFRSLSPFRLRSRADFRGLRELETTTNVVLGTSRSAIVILDIRTMRSLQEFANPLQFGPITCLAIDRKRVWLVVGTAGGTLTLWDLRFGILLRHWSVGQRRVYQVAVHPTKGKGRWVIVTMEEDAVEDEVSKRHGSLVAEVWDIDLGTKVEEFRVVASGQAQGTSSRSTGVFSGGEQMDFSMREASLNPASAIESLLAAPAVVAKPRARLLAPVGASPSSDVPVPSAELRPSRPGVRTFVLGVDYSHQNDQRVGPAGSASVPSKEGDWNRDAGYLMTGGEDRKVRFWDLESIEKSTIVSGLDLEDDRPLFTCAIFFLCFFSSERRRLTPSRPPAGRTRVRHVQRSTSNPPCHLPPRDRGLRRPRSTGRPSSRAPSSRSCVGTGRR